MRIPPGKEIAALFLSPACDMACAFCASEAGFDTMDFASAAALLRALRAAGLRSVVLGGGEPFCWPHDLDRLGRLARALGFLVQVGSNGLAPPPGFATLPWVDRYLLPLEAADASLHDSLRWAPGGHHAVVLSRLDALAASGKEVTIGTVVSRPNLERLGELAEFLRERQAAGLRLHAWHLYRFLPVGRGGAIHHAGLEVELDRYRSAVEHLRRRPLAFPVYRRDDMLRASTVEFCWFDGGRLRLGSERSAQPAAAYSRPSGWQV